MNQRRKSKLSRIARHRLCERLLVEGRTFDRILDHGGWPLECLKCGDPLFLRPVVFDESESERFAVQQLLDRAGGSWQCRQCAHVYVPGRT